MRLMTALTVLTLVCACAAMPDNTTLCSEPRPQVCTMEFLPTCAVLDAGERKEFASPCVACSDSRVVGYVSGSCSK